MTDAPGNADDSVGMPRWVKWFVLVGLVAIVVLVVLMVVGGDHGPGRHASSPHAVSSTVER